MTEFRINNQTVGCMATFPGRFDIVREVVESIAPQLDALFLYVNETTEGLPEFSHLSNVRVFDGREHAGDLSANGKIYVQRYAENCRIFTLDDDFIYPPDYVRKNLDLLSIFDGKCAVTTHGGIFPDMVDWYYDRASVMRSKLSLEHLQLCSIAGSGTFCFDQRWLPLDIDDLLTAVMVDLKVSLAARHAGLPIWVLPRYQNWLTPIVTEGLWERFRAVGITPHTYLAREIDWSFEHYAEIARNALSEAGVSPEQIGMDAELAACLRYGGIPSLWRASTATYRLRSDYLNLLMQVSGHG